VHNLSCTAPAAPAPAEAWSPHAVYTATRLFVSNLNARLAQRFLALVLLPRVRADIRAHKKLHFALYQSLHKATYKPGAFYKARARSSEQRHGWRASAPNSGERRRGSRSQLPPVSVPRVPRPLRQGLLLPLVGSRTCTVREAVVFSSVLQRASLPVLHSAAALLRLAGAAARGEAAGQPRCSLRPPPPPAPLPHGLPPAALARQAWSTAARRPSS
jgi:essential nuclear protein 1